MAYRIMQTYVLLILAILTTGCATTLRFTYNSDPQFATLYAGGTKIGNTPLTVEFPVTDEAKKRGYMLLNGTSVRWVSGASAEVPSVRVDLKNGLSQEITFNRPENYPGREKDQAFVREVFRDYLLLRQVQAQEDLVNIQRTKQLTDSINELNKVLTPPMPVIQPPRPPTNCTSTIVGNTVRTTCY